MLNPLRGRLIAELLPCSYTRESGIVVIDRKSIALKAVVKTIGEDSIDKYGKPVTSDAGIGDVIHFRRYEAKPLDGTREGLKEGKVVVYFTDIVAVEST